MKRIQFNVPTYAKGSPEPLVEVREGYRVWLDLDGARVAFVLQIEGRRPSILAHWASGYRVGSLGDKMLARYVRHPAAYHESLYVWRREAQAALDRAVANKGAAVVKSMLAAVPVLNQ